MQDFIKKEKKVKTTLNLKDDLDKVSNTLHAATTVQKGEYGDNDIQEVIAIKTALTKKEEHEEQNEKVAIKSPHDLDKMEDQYSMKANKSSEKKSMKRLLDETQVDETIEKSENNVDTDSTMESYDYTQKSAVDQGMGTDEIPLEPEFQTDQEHDSDKLIKDLAKSVKLTDTEKTKYDIKPEASKKKCKEPVDENEPEDTEDL